MMQMSSRLNLSFGSLCSKPSGRFFVSSFLKEGRNKENGTGFLKSDKPKTRGDLAGDTCRCTVYHAATRHLEQSLQSEKIVSTQFSTVKACGPIIFSKL